MTEKTLKDYFEGKIPVDILAADIKDSRQKSGFDTVAIYIKNITEHSEYQVTRQHLLKICNDAINGHMTPNDLNTIGFALIASDYFNWDCDKPDGEIIQNTIHDWDNPDMGFELTVGNYTAAYQPSIDLLSTDYIFRQMFFCQIRSLLSVL
jgi:hypothetical protein